MPKKKKKKKGGGGKKGKNAKVDPYACLPTLPVPTIAGLTLLPERQTPVGCTCFENTKAVIEAGEGTYMAGRDYKVSKPSVSMNALMWFFFPLSLPVCITTYTHTHTYPFHQTTDVPLYVHTHTHAHTTTGRPKHAPSTAAMNFTASDPHRAASPRAPSTACVRESRWTLTNLARQCRQCWTPKRPAT